MFSARAGIATVQEKGVKGLAWLSFFLAIAAGAALTATFIRSVVGGIFGFGPSWVAPVVFIVLLCITFVDVFKDFEPNQGAVYSVMALPVVGGSVPGPTSAGVNHLSHNVLNLLTGKFGAYLGVASAFGIAVVLVAASVVVAKRVVKPKAG